MLILGLEYMKHEPAIRLWVFYEIVTQNWLKEQHVNNKNSSRNVFIFFFLLSSQENLVVFTY